MRFNTLRVYPITAEVWVPKDVDENSNVIAYEFSKTIKCRFVSTNNRKVLLAAVGLAPFYQIRNLLDINNVEISPGSVYTIKSLNPVVNAFGFAEEMSYTLSGN